MNLINIILKNHDINKMFIFISYFYFIIFNLNNFYMTLFAIFKK